MKKQVSYEEAYIMNARKKREAKQKRRKRKMFFRFFSFLFVLAAILVSIYYSLGVFFKIEKIKILGESQYQGSQIVKASGIQAGMNIFSCNTKKISDQVEAKLLNIENVHASRQLPNTVVLKISQARPSVALEYQGKYTVLSETGKTLKKNTLTIPENLDIIMGVKVDLLVLGKRIEETELQEKLKTFTQLKDTAKQAGLMGAKTFDLNDPNCVKFLCGPQRNISVRFGGVEQLEYKMRFLAAIFNGSIDEKMSAEVDLTGLLDSKRAVWRPIKKEIEVVQSDEELEDEQKPNTLVYDEEDED